MKCSDQNIGPDGHMNISGGLDNPSVPDWSTWTNPVFVGGLGIGGGAQGAVSTGTGTTNPTSQPSGDTHQSEFNDCAKTAIQAYKMVQLKLIPKIAENTAVATVSWLYGAPAVTRLTGIIFSGVRITARNAGGQKLLLGSIGTFLASAASGSLALDYVWNKGVYNRE